jgi:hypothetical protein
MYFLTFEHKQQLLALLSVIKYIQKGTSLCKKFLFSNQISLGSLPILSMIQA